MTSHIAVNPHEHKDLRVLQERSVAMGDNVMCCITFPEEFRNVQAHYPILFQLNQERDAFVALALFGFENGENLFLKDGKWDASYLPLAMDVQPFLIGMPAEEGGDRKVVFDQNSPRMKEGEGQRLFDEHGIATDYLESISQKLDYLDKGYRGGGDYISALKKYDLLEPLSIDITLKDGNQNRLVGFHTIHEEKFAALDGDALNDLHKNHYLLPSFMMLASLSNLTKLIERKDERLDHDV